MNITITGGAIAWWGAATGTIGLALSTFQAWRDRPHLLIRAEPGYRLTAHHSRYDMRYSYILVRVVNRGRRPVTVMKAWFTFSDSEHRGVIQDSMIECPKELAEGEHVQFLLREDQLELPKVRYVVVEDSIGRLWKQSAKLQSNPDDTSRKMLIVK